MQRKNSASNEVRARLRRAPPVRGAATTAKNASIIASTNQKSAPSTRGKVILAIDPGGSTGLAVRYADASWETVTVTEPSELWEFFLSGVDEVVFEIFATSGRVDKYMIYTIELVGGIKAAIYTQRVHGFAHSPGKRYPYMGQAETMLRGQEHTKHEVDALAHLLAHEARPQP